MPSNEEQKRMRTLSVLTLASIMAVGARPAAAQDTAFTDDSCPMATPAGRHLNEVGAQPTHTNDDMLAAARALADAYRACVASYDSDLHHPVADQSSDKLVVGRMYSRLALARSLQRLGMFHGQLHAPAQAKSEDDAALKSLDEVEAIGAGAQLGAGSEGKLLVESRSLRDELLSAEKALTGATAPGGAPPSTSPAPSATH